MSREGVMPMMEVDESQVAGIHKTFDSIKKAYELQLNKRESNAVKFNNPESLQRVQKDAEKFYKMESPQIAKVNDAIVERANRARMIQAAKDKNRLLEMYDKFTHFVKLNQTLSFLPSTCRNKYSNMLTIVGYW